MKAFRLGPVFRKRLKIGPRVGKFSKGRFFVNLRRMTHGFLGMEYFRQHVPAENQGSFFIGFKV